MFAGHGERGTIAAYQWQCRRTDGGASSASARTIGFAQAGCVKLDAGGWRLEFFVQNDQGVWSLAATHDLTVREVPLAPDLQILRSDIALCDAYGRRADNVSVGETIDVSLAVRNVGDADVGGPVSVRLYEGILPANLRVTEADISLEPGEPRAGDEVRFRAMVRNLSATTAATKLTLTERPSWVSAVTMNLHLLPAITRLRLSLCVRRRRSGRIGDGE